jgi:ATP-binding cassette subfamily B protein
MSTHPLWRLLQYGRAYRSQFIQASLCSVLNKLFDLAPPLLIGWAIDIVLQRENSLLGRWGFASVLHQLIILCLVSALIWTLESLFEYAYARLWRNLAQTLQHELRLDAYQHLQEMELAYFEERSTGGLMSILSDDINQLERFLDGGANEILQVTTTVIIIGSVFVYLSPATALWSAIPIPFILWGSIAFQAFLAPLYGAVREKVSILNGQLSNNLSGIVTIKAFTREAYEVQRIAQESDRYRASNRHAIKYSAAFVPLIRILVFVGFIATLFLGGLEVEAQRLSVGNYSVMIFLTQRLLWPLTRLGETLDQYQRAMASTVRVMQLLDTPVSIVSGDKVIPPDQIRGEVVLNNVCFGYNKNFPIIKNLHLHIPAGKTIGIVGATGSGKSTLVKLLLRFYEMDGGCISIDGIDIRDMSLESLRGCIGWVSQEVFLFHGTVWENIAYGRLSASTAEIMESAQIAEADEFIRQLPQGYDTIVGERGQKLSGGQRQRIAIARAILRNPPILILDEATSAVDNETELAIQRSLIKITQNRTTIAIAHRLSTIRHADCIYVMDQGEVKEVGTHDQLLNQQGIYASLWNLQVGEETPALNF